MANVTYFLGAGASANAIPIVNEFNYRIRDIINFLKDYTNLNRAEAIKVENIDCLRHIIEELKWMLNEAEGHQTIDTLAKKFYHVDTKSLTRLKRALIAYFTIEQSCFHIPIIMDNEGRKFRQKEKVDKRYDALIASILEDTSEINLSKSVKILSWNYDLQFELTLRNYVTDKIIDLQKKYQIFPNPLSLNSENIEYYNPNHFAMVKLNGNAVFQGGSYLIGNEKTEGLCPNDNNSIIFAETLNRITEYYSSIFPKYEIIENIDSMKYFNYSWESSEKYSEKYLGYYSNLEVAKQIAVNTHTLIIVGYSFPFFNRKIDYEIFNSMKALRKIIIQDYNAEEIKNRLCSEFPKFSEPFWKVDERILITSPGKYFPTPSELLV